MRIMLGLLGAAVAVVALAAAGVVLWPRERPVDLARGAVLYAEHCAACHGADLEGEPDWQTPHPDGRLRAPPHDASGHTWHHADAVLFAITRDGSAAVVGGGYESDMMGFGDVLSDAEIHDVLGFIKASWPPRERAYQAAITARNEGRRP